jgi:hypothetical protein
MFLKFEPIYPLKPLPRAGLGDLVPHLSPSNPYLERVSDKKQRGWISISTHPSPFVDPSLMAIG